MDCASEYCRQYFQVAKYTLKSIKLFWCWSVKKTFFNLYRLIFLTPFFFTAILQILIFPEFVFPWKKDGLKVYQLQRRSVNVIQHGDMTKWLLDEIFKKTKPDLFVFFFCYYFLPFLSSPSFSNFHSIKHNKQQLKFTIQQQTTPYFNVLEKKKIEERRRNCLILFYCILKSFGKKTSLSFFFRRQQ